MKAPLLSLEVRQEADVVVARQRARQIAALIGLPLLDQTRVATAVSEIARHAVELAGGGRVEFVLENGQPLMLTMMVRERTAGAKNTPPLVDGDFSRLESPPASFLSAQRLVDQFKMERSSGGGLTLTMSKAISKRQGSFSPQELSNIAGNLAKNAPQSLFEELQAQNQELLRALQELRDRQAEVAQMHRKELEETNRGVVALYTELDEDLKTWRRMSDLKTKFLSNMSHEFRSPVNSILNLTGFLLDRSDGELNTEQEKQIRFIRKAAEGLASLVNDLLDIAKVEAGKATVRVERFKVADLFENLKTSISPLLEKGNVELIFEDSIGLPALSTDEGKVTQVLRNFLSNAVKYTERGEIRVSARRGPGEMLVFSVADTGVGVAPDDLEQIFEEFVQIEGPLQGKTKGTGLGLPLCRKLAHLLGGSVHVQSKPGVGSTFFFVLPRIYKERDSSQDSDLPAVELDPARLPVLVVEDNPLDLLLYHEHLEGTDFQIVPASNLSQARQMLKQIRPMAVLLDIRLEAEMGWSLLSELKNRPETRDIPIIVLTMIDGRERALELGAWRFFLKPIDRASLLRELEEIKRAGTLESILIIDDADRDRYLLRKQIDELGRFRIREAANGADGLRLAREDSFDVIFLDLLLPDINGFEILESLKSDPSTEGIPVIINTSAQLEAADRERLKATTAIVSKSLAEQDDFFAMIRDSLMKAGLIAFGVAGGQLE